MSWNIKTPGDYINGPLTVAGVTQFNSNIAVGITPNTWSSLWKGGQFGRLTLVNTSTDSLVGHNFYNDGSYRFVANDFASYYDQVGGGHIWGSSVTSGIAGNVITWTTLATLNNTGLGLGTAPTQRLTVSGNISLTNSAATSIGLTNATSGITYTLFSASPSGNGFTGFGIYDGSAYIMRTNSQGDFGVGVLPDNTKSACLQLKSGISFPATQSASTDGNTLDDYEEGTWTGTLKGATTDPTTPVTQTGRYTKVGRQVYVEIIFGNVNTTGASGAVSVNGLPFLNNSSITSQGSILSDQAITFTGSPFSFIEVAQSRMQIFQSNSNAPATTCSHNPGGGRYLYISQTYTVA